MSLIYQFALGRVLFNDEILMAAPLFSSIRKKEKSEREKNGERGLKEGKFHSDCRVIIVIIVTLSFFSSYSYDYVIWKPFNTL